MKKFLFLIVIMTLSCGIWILTAKDCVGLYCDKTYDGQDQSFIRYLFDERTGLCFAISPGGYNVNPFIEVKCSEKVMTIATRIIMKQK